MKRREAKTLTTRMTTKTDTWTRSVGQSALGLIVDAQSHVTQSHTRTNVCLTL